MTRLRSRGFLIAVLLLGAASLEAQRPPLDAATATVRSCALTLRGGSPCADGVDYRAVFDDRGVTFAPALGRRVPTTRRVRFATVDFARADRHDVTRAESAPPRLDERSVRYARAAGIEERHRATPAGIELSYVFERPLPGTGDLVVLVRVEGDLCSDGVLRDDGSLRFVDPTGNGGIRVGGITGVDARGAVAAGRLGFDGEHLELRLPAAFVDRAVYPLVLDPLIGTDFGVIASYDTQRPDVAYDAASQRYLVVSQREFSTNDINILGQLLDAHGNATGPLLMIRNVTYPIALRPTVASVRMRGRFVVAWQESGGLVPPWLLRGRCVNPDGVMSTVATLGTGTHDQQPRLGSNETTSDDGVLLAWRTDSAVEAARVIVPAGTAPPWALAPTHIVTSLPGLGDIDVSNSCGPAGRWVVVWNGTDFTTNVLRAQALDLNVGAVGPVLDVEPPGAAAGHDPVVDGDGTNFVVAYERSGDAYCRGIRWDSGSGQLVTTTAAIPVATSTDVERNLAIARLGPKYLVAWSRLAPNSFDAEIEGIAIDPLSCIPCGQPFALSRPGTREFQPRIGAQVASSPAAGDEAMIVFASAALAPPFLSSVLAQRFEAFGAGGAVTNVGGGCGPSYRTSESGPVVVGNRTLRLQIDGVLGAAIALLGVGVPQPPITCGACMVTPPFVTVAAAVRGDVAVVPFGLPCGMVDLAGATVELQWWIVGSPQSPCPIAPQLSFSDRLQATIGL